MLRARTSLLPAEEPGESTTTQVGVGAARSGAERKSEDRQREYREGEELRRLEGAV